MHKVREALRALMACGAAVVALASCAQGGGTGAGGGAHGNETLTVLNWNVQTFFDATADGTEYDGYVPGKSWGQGAYVERLERLARSLRALDAEVVVLEEIENEAVLHDICNFLAGEWNAHKVYAHACFAKDEGSAIGCAVLSRYPLERLTVHGIGAYGDPYVPRMRPLMQVSVRKGAGELVLFVNHWKSMSAGKAVTERWRDRQERVLSRRMAACVARGKAALACGDFNRDIGDFCPGTYPDAVLLRREAPAPGVGVEVLSPWYDGNQELVEPGSYYFNGEWSRIDNFFAAGAIEVLSFAPCTDGPWCDAGTKVPEKYALWTGGGYSDHLPVLCTVRF